MESNTSSTTLSSSSPSRPSAASPTSHTSASPAVISAEAHVEAVLTGMNRFAALSRAFVKPSGATTASAASASHRDGGGGPTATAAGGGPAGSITPVLLPSGGSKTAPALAAGTSLLDRIQPALPGSSSSSPPSAESAPAAPSAAATPSPLMNGHANPQKNAGGPSLGHVGGRDNLVGSAPPTPTAAATTATTTTTPVSKLYRPPHARDDASRHTTQSHSQAPIASSSPTEQHASPTATPAAATTIVRSPAFSPESSGAFNSRSTPGAAAATSTARNPSTSSAKSPPASAAPATETATAASTLKGVSPSSTLTTPTVTMAARLREGTAGTAALLPPSVNEVNAASKSGAVNSHGGSSSSSAPPHGHEQQQQRHRDASAHSHHSLSLAEASGGGGGGGSSYVAVARRAGGVAASAAARHTPEKHSMPPASSPSTAQASTSEPDTARATADTATTAITPNTSCTPTNVDTLSALLETLTAEEFCGPSQSRSAKRKRKLRAMKAAANAAGAAVVEAQMSEMPVPAVTPSIEAAVGGAADAGEEAGKQPQVPVSARATAGTVAAAVAAANTCGLSRRPGWHPSLAVAAAMVSSETMAEMAASAAAAAAAGYVTLRSANTGVSSSSSSSTNNINNNSSLAGEAMMNYGGHHMNPLAAAAASSIATSSAGESPVQELVGPNAHPMQQHHYPMYNAYASPAALQPQLNYYNSAGILTSLRPHQQQQPLPLPAVESTSSHGGGSAYRGSGAAGTMFDPYTTSAATTASQEPSPTSTTAATAVVAAGPTRGGGLHRGRGAEVLHASSNAAAKVTSNVASTGSPTPQQQQQQQQQLPHTASNNATTSTATAARVPALSSSSSSSSMLQLQRGQLPTIRVGAAGTLVHSPMHGPHAGSGGSSNAAVAAGGLSAFVESPTPVQGGSGVSRHHHHQHHSPVTFAPPAGSAPHDRTSSSYSGNSSGPATTRTNPHLRGRGGEITAEDANAAQSGNEYGGHAFQQQQQQQQSPQDQAPELQYAEEWSSSPFPTSTLHGANVGWSGSANTKTNVSGSAKGQKTNTGGGSNSSSSPNRTNSRGPNTNPGSASHHQTSSTNAAAQQMYNANGSPAMMGGPGMNTYNSNFRNASAGGGGSGAGAAQGGRYSANHHQHRHQQQQQQHSNNYMNPALYTDQIASGGMNRNTPSGMSHRRSAVLHSNNRNSSALRCPMPYYDFITVLPTFVSTCLTLQPEDEAAREQLCWTIEAVLRHSLTKNAELRVHGSITTGLALPSSDVDVLVVGYQPIAPLEALQMLSQALIELDDASLKDALEFQESVEQEKHRQKLAEQQQGNGGAGDTQAPASTSAGTQENPSSTSLTEQADKQEKPSNSSNSTTAHSSTDASKEEDNNATADNGEVSRLSTSASPSTVAENSSVAVSGIAVPPTTSPSTAASAGTAESVDTPSQRPFGYALDGRKAFLTATTALLAAGDDDDDAVVVGHYGAGTKAAKQVKEGVARGAARAHCTTTTSATAAAAGPARRGYGDFDNIAAEETEVYGTVDDVEQAEEVFRDQIEKDYSFSTTLDVSTLFAPLMGGSSSSGGGVGGGGGGLTSPKMPSSPSQLTGSLSRPPFSAPASATRDRASAAAAAVTTTATGTATASDARLSSSSSTASSTSAHSSDTSSATSSPSFSASSARDASAPAGGTSGGGSARKTASAHVQGEEEAGRHEKQQHRGVDAGTPQAAAETQATRTRSEEGEVATAKEKVAESTAAAVTVITSTADATAAATTAAPTTTTSATAAAAQRPSIIKKGAPSTTVLDPPVGGRPGSHLTFVPVHDGQFFYVQAITATRVPVIKLTDKATGTKVDITFAGGEHWRSMQLTRSLLDVFPQARPLILLLKFCVRSLGIGESEPGGVTSFTIYLMVLHFYNECRKRVLLILQEREAAALSAAAAAAAAGPSATTYNDMVQATSPHAHAARVEDNTVRSATPLPRLSAVEEQQPSGRGAAPSPTGAYSQPAATASPTITAAASTTATATTGPPLDLGLLESFLGEYLARVEQRHAQMLEAKTAEAAAANSTADATAAVTDMNAPPDNAEHDHDKETATSTAISSPSSPSAVTHVNERGSRSSSVGACATIRAAYGSADKAHLQLIREMILGFIGKPSAALTGVVPGPSNAFSKEDSREEQPPPQPPHSQRNLPASVTGVEDSSGAVLGDSSAPLPPGVAAAGVPDGDVNSHTDSGQDSRGRHAPRLHHYLLKMVEPQPHELSPGAADATVAATEEKEAAGRDTEEADGAVAAPHIASTPQQKEGSRLAELAEVGVRDERAEGTAADAGKESRAAVDGEGVGDTHAVSMETTREEEETADAASDGRATTAAIQPNADSKQDDNAEDAMTVSKHDANEGAAEEGEPLPPSSPPPQSSSVEAYEKFAEDFLQRQVKVSDAFLDFCHYYGCAFDYEAGGIRFSIDGSSEVVEKPCLCSRRGQHFHLTSPFDPEYDLTARMTHMRDFQWLCWWFTEWGAARQSPMYYGGCSLQYVLQCLSPQTADADCQAVHQTLMEEAYAVAQAAAQQRRREDAGGMGGVQAPMHYPAQQPPQQQQSYPSQQPQSGVGVNGGGMPNAAQQQEQQQEMQHASTVMMSNRPAGDDFVADTQNHSNSRRQDSNPEAILMQQQQQQQKYAAMSSYGQQRTTDLQFQQQQQQYHFSPTGAPVAAGAAATTATGMRNDNNASSCGGADAPTTFLYDTSSPHSHHYHYHHNVSSGLVERSDSSHPTAESVRTDGDASARCHRQASFPSLQQLPYVDSRETLEGFVAYGAPPATAPTTTSHNPNVVTREGEGEGGEVAMTFHVMSDGGTTTSAGSTREDEHTSNDKSPLDGVSSEDAAQQAAENVDIDDAIVFDEDADADAAVMAAMPHDNVSDHGSINNGGGGTQGSVPMPMFAGGYPQQTSQQAYGRPYGEEMVYYDMQQQPPPQQNQQTAQATAFYYQAYANMNNAYIPQQPPQAQQQPQQPYSMAAAPNFYASPQAMLYPSQQLAYRQQPQQAVAATSNSTNYPFPLLHYDVQQYLWMQEQQQQQLQQQQQQQQQKTEAARSRLSHEQGAEGSPASNAAAAALSPASPAIMPAGPTNTAPPPPQQQKPQQQQYYAAYAAYPNVYNEAVWNPAVAGGGGDGGGGGQPTVPMTGPYPRPANPSMNYAGRGGARESTTQQYPQQQQQQQGARGGHSRTGPRRQVSAHETRGAAAAFAPQQQQQQQQHAHHPRQPSKTRHQPSSLPSSSPGSVDPASHAAAAPDGHDGQGQSRDVGGRGGAPVSGQREQHNQGGSPAVDSLSPAPTAEPRTRT